MQKMEKINENLAMTLASPTVAGKFRKLSPIVNPVFSTTKNSPR